MQRARRVFKFHNEAQIGLRLAINNGLISINICKQSQGGARAGFQAAGMTSKEVFVERLAEAQFPLLSSAAISVSDLHFCDSDGRCANE